MVEQRTPTGPGGAPAPDDDVLLATKLRLPRQRTGTVPRSRLSHRLTEATTRELTLVCAPAGSGKTTLLADWARTARQPVAWLSLDEGDNDVVRFWRYVAAALDQLHGGIERQLAARLAGPRSFHPDMVMATLVNTLTALPDAALLVVDDYHMIDAPAVHGSLTRLLELLPPQLRVVLASRAEPPLPLGRWRARGQLAELRTADLAFRADEAAALLSGIAGAALDDDAVDALTRRTEGWVAGLQLAGLSLRDHPDPDRFVETFSGSHRHVLDYLAEEVLARQPDEVVGLLLETSVLDQVCGPLAQVVTGRGDSQQLLEQIERANLFLVPLDDVRGWWRYHRLFADLLQARLVHEQPGRVPELHRAAAAWWEGHDSEAGQPQWPAAGHAIRHALAAGDPGWAARLVERHFDAAFHRAEETTLARWLAAMPDATVGSRPRLLVIRAFLALLGGRLDETEQLIADAESTLETAGDESFEPSVGRAKSMVANLPAAVAVLRAQLARFRGDTDGAIANGRRARAALTSADRALGAVVDWQLAVADWLQGRVRDAERKLRELVSVQRAGSFRSTWPHYDLGQVLLAQGRLDAALEVFEQVIEDPGLGHVGVAEVGFARDELDAALDHATAGVEACRLLAHDLPLAIALAMLARVRQARGDPEGAAKAIDEAARVVPAGDVTALVNPVPTERARLLLARGEVSEAARWAGVGGWDALDDLSYQREREHLVTARLLLAQGRPDQASALLERLHGPAVAQDRTGSVIEVQALRALSLGAAGDEASALSVLADAVALAQPEGHVRVFTQDGAPMADLLARLVTSGRLDPVIDAPAAGHVGRLLRSVRRASPSAADHARGAAPGLVAPLTDRELEVLELLAAGSSNQQIADRLVVALVTVKKHVSNLLTKLGAANRTEAVARARGLGLLR